MAEIARSDVCLEIKTYAGLGGGGEVKPIPSLNSGGAAASTSKCSEVDLVEDPVHDKYISTDGGSSGGGSLSPTLKWTDDGEEEWPVPDDFVAMLKRPGVPPIDSVADLKKLVGAAPRAWTANFKMAGGRDSVNIKLQEMERLEHEMMGWRSFLKKRPSKELVEAREELMKVLLYMYLR